MTSEYDLRYPPGKPRPNVQSLGLLARKYAAEGIPPVPPYLDIEDSEPHEVAQKQQSPGDRTGAPQLKGRT